MCRVSKRNAFDESGFSSYISQEHAGLGALHIDLIVPWGVISDVDTKILLGKVNFKLSFLVMRCALHLL